MEDKAFSYRCAAVNIGLFLLLLIFLAAPSALADQVIYTEGFEADNGGYTIDGNAEWEWGSPTNVGPASANSGTKCWGSDLDDNFNASAEGNIYSPAISLPEILPGQSIRVRFYAYIDIYDMESRGEFFVSSDSGETWQSLAELFGDMTGGWEMFEFDVSEYAGGDIFLRFRVYEGDGSSSYPGFYVDDIAITRYDNIGESSIFTLEAWEDDSPSASCPWVFPWTGETYVKDNDIYSVARTQKNEYRDFYLLQKIPVAKNGRYELEIRETENEDSWTDMAGLIAVDHGDGVAVAPDDKGNIFAYTPADLISPASAVTDSGKSVLALLNTKNDSGCAVYSQDFIEIDFGSADTSGEARIVLRVKGFIMGEGEEKPYIGPPAIVVKTMDSNGEWQAAGRLKPRFQWSECAFDLTGLLPDKAGQNKIRLYSISHSKKYHEIDFVGLSTGPQPEMKIAALPLAAATCKGKDVTSLVSSPENIYLKMTKGDHFSLSFESIPQVLPKRDFVLVSEGYYIPKSGTYFIYTWDGTNWIVRDGYSYPGTDLSKTFDLSLFLPDPSGEYKVRIWQDYQYEPAGIDFTGLNNGGDDLVVDYATYLKDGTDVSNEVSASDDLRLDFGWGEDPYVRDRWIEVKWMAAGTVNRPPTVSPVNVTQADGKITWTYADAENDPQTQFEIEIWTGPGATGDIAWDPEVGEGTDAEADYPKDRLTNGNTYYARVRAHDGNNWGGWSEAVFSEYESPPDQPVNQSPADHAVIGDDVRQIDLQASAYAEPVGEDAHEQSHWQVRRVDGKSTLVNIDSQTELTQCTIQDDDLEMLDAGLQYAWGVTYEDTNGDTSPMSRETVFTVGSSETDTNVVIQGGKTVEDYRMVSFVQWPNNPACAAVLGDELGRDFSGKNAKIGTYNPDIQGYNICGNDFNITPGKSYWMIAKNGLHASVNGVMVSLTHDIEVDLKYNMEADDGWNMIAPPNKADYAWEDIEIVVYDNYGNVIYGPVPIWLLNENNDYIDLRLWRWENGEYFSDTTVMDYYGGYWVKVKRPNVSLRFVQTAQIDDYKRVSALVDKVCRSGAKLARKMLSPKSAIADDEPPQPMSAFTDVSSGGGCFIEQFENLE